VHCVLLPLQANDTSSDQQVLKLMSKANHILGKYAQLILSVMRRFTVEAAIVELLRLPVDRLLFWGRPSKLAYGLL